MKNKYTLTLIIAVTALAAQSALLSIGLCRQQEYLIIVSGVQFIGWSFWTTYVIKRYKDERKKAI